MAHAAAKPPEHGQKRGLSAGKTAAVVTRPAGLEPATFGLEIRCSIRLSYGRYALFQRDLLRPYNESETATTTFTATSRSVIIGITELAGT